jgi:hypothetical protein
MYAASPRLANARVMSTKGHGPVSGRILTRIATKQNVAPTADHDKAPWTLIGVFIRRGRPQRQCFSRLGEQAHASGTIANTAQNRIVRNEKPSLIPPIVPAREKAPPDSHNALIAGISAFYCPPPAGQLGVVPQH